MWLQRIRQERRKVEDDTGHIPDFLIIRPELSTILCEEIGDCPFGMLEALDGMIVATSDLLVEEYSFGVYIHKYEE